MVVFENNFCKFSQIFGFKVRLNIFSHLTIYGQIRTKYSSCRVLQGCIVFLIKNQCVQVMKIKHSLWIKSFQKKVSNSIPVVQL